MWNPEHTAYYIETLGEKFIENGMNPNNDTYNEFVRFINESNTQPKEVLTELYFLACEQIRTGYIPASPLTINLFR